MATRALVGLQESDGTVTSIYVHWDGYPGGVGQTLVRHYTSEEHVRALLATGAHSTLDAEPEVGAYNDGTTAITGGWSDAGQNYVYLFHQGAWTYALWDWKTEQPGSFQPLRVEEK